jgi:hypothetical protein
VLHQNMDIIAFIVEGDSTRCHDVEIVPIYEPYELQ